MRHSTVSLGEDAQIPFEVALNGVAVDATALPAVTEVWVNGVYDAARSGDVVVSQLQDAGAANVPGAYFLELNTDGYTVLDSVQVRVEATPTGGSLVSDIFAVSFVDPAANAVSEIR